MTEEIDTSALDAATDTISEALGAHANVAATSLWGVTGYKKQSRTMQFIDASGYVMRVTVDELVLDA